MIIIVGRVSWPVLPKAEVVKQARRTLDAIAEEAHPGVDSLVREMNPSDVHAVDWAEVSYDAAVVYGCRALDNYDGRIGYVALRVDRGEPSVATLEKDVGWFEPPVLWKRGQQLVVEWYEVKPAQPTSHSGYVQLLGEVIEPVGRREEL